MELNSKEIRLGIENIDRISELPESLLSLILCNLPTKNAVGTSILSTRWKNLFPFCFTPVKIALDDSLFLNPNRGENNNSSFTPCVAFIDFVDKMFNVTLSDVACVEEIILHCHKQYDEDKIVSWANTALRLNVRHLDIYFLHSESNAWFDCLNGCSTLVTLHLSVLSVFNVPDDFSLPNLKKLEFLKFIYGYDDNPITQLIQGCPALECLDLYQRNLESPHDICIRCPLLKKLVIKGGGELFINQLTLDAPNLQEFIYKGVRADFYDVCELNSLHTADFAIRFEEGLRESDDDIIHYSNSTAMIVSRCSSTIRLYLSDCAIDALHGSSMQLPVFHNLMRLTLGYLHWSILTHLLQIVPNLEQLTIEEGIQENEVEFQNLMHLLPTPPECLVLSVKKIEFGVFEGQEDEIKIVEYFLKYGGVLQNLILHCIPCTDMSILTRLLLLARLSKTCKIDCILK